MVEPTIRAMDAVKTTKKKLERGALIDADSMDGRD